MSGSAALAVTGSCTVGNVTYTLSDVAANDANNVFCASGNPDYSDDMPGVVIESFFGMDYTLSFKSDEAKGDGAVTFTDMMTHGEAPIADWAISSLAGIAESAVIVMKQSNSYAAFLLSSTSGDWSISGPGNSKNKYSHVDIWYKPDDGGGGGAIPLPAGLPLMLTALGLGGIAARRARKKSA